MYAYRDAISNKRKADIISFNKAFGYNRIRQTMGFEMIDNHSCNLRSYCTDIASLEFATGNTNKPVLHVNWSMFDCSNTTIRHFSEWLRVHSSIGFTYHEIKEFSKHYEPDVFGRFTGEIFWKDGTDVVVAFDL